MGNPLLLVERLAWHWIHYYRIPMYTNVNVYYVVWGCVMRPLSSERDLVKAVFLTRFEFLFCSQWISQKGYWLSFFYKTKWLFWLFSWVTTASINILGTALQSTKSIDLYISQTLDILICNWKVRLKQDKFLYLCI